MNWPNPGDFRELRRGLPVVAALLFVGSLALPMWHIHIRAVQYPETVFHLKLYAYPRLAGDYTQVHSLNKYIGFYYPDPVFLQPNYTPHPYAIDVPEWSLGPVAFVAVSALSAFVALAPSTEKLRRGVTWQLAGTVLVFGVMLADIQYRLWQAGHHLDPDAPVMGVGGFTPPIWGQYQVANVTSTSHFGPGAFVAGGAVGLLAVAFYYRDSTATFGELPDRMAGRIDRAREWLDEHTEGDDQWDESEPEDDSPPGRERDPGDVPEGGD
ncbi:MAG: hypothetical protein ABEJ40_03105 [Haloarculaceae archaeon]